MEFLFPFQGFYEMSDIVGNEIYHWLQRVVVGIDVKIERAAQEMLCAVGEIELHRRRNPLTIKKIHQTIDVMLFVDDEAVADTRSLL